MRLAKVVIPKIDSNEGMVVLFESADHKFHSCLERKVFRPNDWTYQHQYPELRRRLLSLQRPWVMLVEDHLVDRPDVHHVILDDLASREDVQAREDLALASRD